MSDETTPDQLYAKKHRFTIDWTVNVTSVASFAVGCITAASLYYGLDRRINRMEELAPVEAASRKEKELAVQKSLTDLSSDLKDVKSAVDKVSRAIEVQNAVADAKASRK